MNLLYASKKTILLKVEPGSSAEVCGRVMVGDQIVQVSLNCSIAVSNCYRTCDLRIYTHPKYPTWLDIHLVNQSQIGYQAF